MRVRFQVIVATLLLTILIATECQAMAAPHKKLVFEGVVTSITTIDHPLRRWLVTVKVTKVISGEFSGSTFQFAVHSPAQSGLEKGATYIVEAIWKDNGYVVDEDQWRRRKRSQARASFSVSPCLCGCFFDEL